MQRYAWPATARLVRFFTVDEPARFCRISGSAKSRNGNYENCIVVYHFHAVNIVVACVSHMMAS